MCIRQKFIGGTPNNDYRLDVEVVVPLVNCEIELDLSWSWNCIISELSRTSRPVPNANPVWYEVATTTNSATCQIDNAKLLCSSCYVIILNF